LTRNGDRIAFGTRASFDVPPAARGIVFQLFPRNRPLLAVARMEGNRLRLAWLVPNGVALVEADPGSNTASSPRPGTLVTGLDNAVKLQFSRNGDYLTAVQLSWGSINLGQLRLWNLAGDRALPSGGDELVKEACRVAAQEPGGARFTPEEVDIWFGDKRPVQQPCEKWSP
jgi:hypothetical protein